MSAEQQKRLAHIKGLLSQGKHLPRTPCGDCQKCFKTKMFLKEWTK